MNYFQKKNAFTLIELLVVIAIIGVLASVVFASTNTARAKARDARRVADFNQLRLALELYYDDNNVYPGPASGVCNPGINEHNDGWCRDTRNNNGVTPIDSWIPGLGPYMPSMPHNPKPYSPRLPEPYHYCLCGNNSCAANAGTNQIYWLHTSLENDSPRTCGGGAVYLWFDGT
ncbi:MAG: type II secretion system protein, partial [Patescibacteria group bacterium]